jgi:quercetin dioxygenase-like cupin family protein
MKSIFITGFILLIIGSIRLSAQNHVNHHNEKITENYLLKQLLNEHGLSNKEVQMEVVNFPPGSVSPPHRHTCPTFGYVLEGEIESVFESKHYLYKQGDALYEKPYGLHAVTRNRDLKRQAKLLVFFINEPAKPNSVPVSNKTRS